MENVEYSQYYQHLVEQRPDEFGLGKDEYGQGVHQQANQTENGLKTEKIIDSRSGSTLPGTLPLATN